VQIATAVLRLKIPVALLVLRSLVRNRRRSAIALATVGFGVAALVMAGGFVDGLLVKLREDTIHSRLGHIQIQHRRFSDFGVSKPYAYLLPTNVASMEPIARLAGVTMVSPRLGINGLISVGETTLSFAGQGVDAANEIALSRGLAIRSGSSLQPGDTQGVLLGEGLAANLGVKAGDTVALLVTTGNGTFNGADFQVRGTFSSVSKAYDDVALRVPLVAAEHLLRVSGAQQWLVLLDDTSRTTATMASMAALLPGDRFALTSWDQNADFYRKTAELFARQFGFVKAVILAIIVLSILNVMTMNVLERTWEIGLMLALGDSRTQILALFASEGIVLGIVGAILGAGIALASATVINFLGIPMPAPPGMSHGFDAGISVSALLIINAVTIGTLATAFAALPPSIRASRLPVVDALRASH
jgi:putative ABC transport system permease protein